MRRLLPFLSLLFLLVVPRAAQPEDFTLHSSWSVQATPAAATQATVTLAAKPGGRHVAVSGTVCAIGVAAQGPIVFNLRDGATGAGTILWSVTLEALAGASACQSFVVPGIKGSVNVAMTLESSAAPAATNLATVTLQGYDSQY
jgi:hypothetical protein